MTPLPTPTAMAAVVGMMLGACALGGCQASREPFVCPTAQAGGRDGVLPESPQAMAELGAQLATDDQGNVLGETVVDLRRRYPEAQDAAIVDFIVTAKCPSIAADPSLSVKEKREAFDAYAQAVFDRVGG